MSENSVGIQVGERLHSRQRREGLHTKTPANQNTYQLAQMSFFTHANYCSRFVLICRDFLFLKLLPRQSKAVAEQATRTERTERIAEAGKKNLAVDAERNKKTKTSHPIS